MTRLLLLSVLAVVTWYYFPETRAILLDVAEPIVTPIVKWNGEQEMGQVVRNVVEHERLTGQLPAGKEWLAWLDYRYSAEAMHTDPWGSVYQLLVWQDSIAIVSLGPDRTRLTKDDFMVVSPRGE